MELISQYIMATNIYSYKSRLSADRMTHVRGRGNEKFRTLN